MSNTYNILQFMALMSEKFYLIFVILLHYIYFRVFYLLLLFLTYFLHKLSLCLDLLDQGLVLTDGIFQLFYLTLQFRYVKIILFAFWAFRKLGTRYNGWGILKVLFLILCYYAVIHIRYISILLY